MNQYFEHIPKIEKDPDFSYGEIREVEKSPAPVQSKRKSLRKLLREAIKELKI
ncbi:hypothetical protein HOG07_00415, partial [Candidatus Woesearchaeota archaeon]|nr:hypothetical protein [Candidatus Woesearchaeota archaeon]